MPWVEVVHKENIRPLVLDRLGSEIQEIVAKALHVQESERARLVPDDVEVEFRLANPRSRCRQINIIIQANAYPEREWDIKRRADQIAEKVSCVVNHGATELIHGLVYIPTMKGFAEF